MIKSTVKGSQLETRIQVVGYRLNRLDELVFMAGPKPMQTEFGIYDRLESCAWFYQLLFYGGKLIVKRSFTCFFTDNLFAAILMRWVFRFRKAFYTIPLRYIMLTITIAKNMNGSIMERVTPYQSGRFLSIRQIYLSSRTVQHSPLK